MIKKEIIITNKTGLHARPATQFVQTAGKFKSSIKLIKDDKTLNAKSIVSVLSGGIGNGTKLTLVADGEDEEAALKTLADLIESNFGE